MRNFATTAPISLRTASSAGRTTVLRLVAITLFLLAVVLADSAPAQTRSAPARTGSAPAQTCSSLPCWTPVAASWQGTHAGAYHALLLTDGTVMVQEGSGCCDGTQYWWRLTPDEFGSYINGSWSALAAMPSIGGVQYCPSAYASAVLPDGRVIVEGGEDNCGGPGETTLGAIFDPTISPPMGQWTPVPPPTGWTTIGDGPSAFCPNGHLYVGQLL